MNETEFIRKLYYFIQSNSPNRVTEDQMMKEFSIKKEELRHYFHIMKYKYNLPFLFDFRTKNKKKTICNLCFQNLGEFHQVNIERDAKGTRIYGIFVCDKCYNEL